MQKRTLVALTLAVLAIPVWGQDNPPAQEKKLTFKMKDASVDAVLQYVSSVTGWIFVQEKPTSGTISAVSDTDVPLSKVLDFLNSALRPLGRVILNPNSPDLPAPGQTLKVLDVSDALKRGGADIHVGTDPKDIPLTDQVRTQIIPLKAVNVIDVQKELGDLLRSALTGTAEGTSGSMAISTYSNSVILTGRSEGINRAVRILRVIDVSTSAELKIRVFPLKNADATETAKTLNEVFKKETMKAETGQQNPMSNLWRMFGGGGGGGGGGRGERGGGEGGGNSPAPRALAAEMVRITAEARTNSVIVSATEENMKLIEDLIVRLDDKTASAVKLKLYSLRYADATSVSKLVNDLFSETPTNASQQNRNGNRGMPVWMAPPGGGTQQEAQGATKEVRAVPDLRTNSVLVAASEQRLVLIDAVMTEIDRQVNDLLEVKVYKLENADATQMAAILTSLFQPQIKATQATGQTGGNPGNQGQGRGFGGAGPGVTMAGANAGTTGQLLPSQEVEIAADIRTRSVVVKASKSYIQIVDAVVKQLDQDPTEAVSTFVYKFKNADAASLAPSLQNLLRWPQGSATGMQQNNRPNQNQGPFQGMQQNSSLSGSSSGFGTSGGSPGGGGSRLGNLGPLEGPQDGASAPAPAPMPQDEGEARRNVEGNVDLQADPTTNSLIVRTSPRNFMAMQNMFRELDRIRPQVLIKVLIADVTIDNSVQFGVEGFWENNMTPHNSTTSVNKVATAFPLSTSGLTYTLTADNGKYQATLNLFASEGKLKVLATPRILVLDNQTANINVGQSVPRITNTQISSISGTAINSVTYTNVGVILNVTPHIHPDGLVTMVVAPEISDVASAAESVPLGNGVTSPTFDLNTAQTTVAIRNGTTVVLGGMIHDSYDDTVQKVPVLGDIPLLGFLFSNTSRTVTKRELMIFLTPYVVFTEAELEEITQLEKAHMRFIDLRDIEAESDHWLERVRK